jgi:hypothetical protein
VTHRKGHWQGSRRGLLGFAGAGGLLLLARGTRAFAARGVPASLLGDLRVVNGGRPFAGDRPLLATVGSKDRTARISFTLARRAAVTLAILQTGQGAASEQPTRGAEGTLRTSRKVFGAGDHVVDWTPATSLAPRTYLARISARPLDGKVETKQAVVRLLGIDAAFSERSAAPGTEATLVVRTDASALTLQMLRSGPETVPTYANSVINGIAVGAPVQVDWSQNGGAPAAITVPVGSDWASGVYAAQITGDDGRRGFAPLVVRPTSPQARVAVVLPTSTWAAYNFYDADGDGWGDTWYARWKTNDVDLTRPHSTNGVPYRYRSYDLGFQHWLAQTGKRADMMSDEDLELFATPADLRAAYDLLVFPGHTEYVTGRVYDLVEAFRDKGGNLMFLAANNFFRKSTRKDQRQTLVDEWRDLGRPESALLGKSVHRVGSRPATCAVHRRRRRRRTVGVRRNRAHERRDVRAVRDRDRRALGGVTGLDPGARGHPGSLWAGPHRRDDLLRALERRQGVQRGRARLRRPDAPLARDAADRRERLVTTRAALTRGTRRRAARSRRTGRSSRTPG